MTKPLAGKVAIVTGGSRGIGREVALGPARQGARVTVSYRQAPRPPKVVAEIAARVRRRRRGRRRHHRRRPLPGGGRALLRLLMDVLVSNAGITRDNLLLRMTEEDWDAVLDTNLKGAFHCVKAVQRTFLKRRAGRIIAIGSIVGLAGNAGQANYAAAKAGLVGLMRSVARELGSRGITANVVAPGFIDTEMTRALPPEAMDQALARITRLGTPDVAGLVAFWRAMPPRTSPARCSGWMGVDAVPSLPGRRRWDSAGTFREGFTTTPLQPTPASADTPPSAHTRLQPPHPGPSNSRDNSRGSIRSARRAGSRSW